MESSQVGQLWSALENHRKGEKETKKQLMAYERCKKLRVSVFITLNVTVLQLISAYLAATIGSPGA